MISNGRSSLAERLFDVFNYVFMALFSLVCIYPFYYVLIYSISDPRLASKGIYFWPAHFDFDSYIKVLSLNTIPHAFLISVEKTLIFTVLCVYFSAMLAFLFTKRVMPLRKTMYRIVISSMYLNSGLIPWYITMKTYGLRDSFLLYVLPGIINAFYIILIKTYIEQMPASLEESAEIDGAGFLTIFNRIIFPLSKPIVATVAVYASVGCWNTWIDNYLLVDNEKLQTIQVILFAYLNEAQGMATDLTQMVTNANSGRQLQLSPETIKMSITVISVLPIILVYPFLQKNFIKGIMLGAVKG
ncbi:putative aldouronate transport system permease protein [Paenibacillus taihuensis]|uniref:Putative aldouronate transport system permease protein n=1 Tax=Paenibacillus taihuensis TaxID=1156355 RepID=A0A3D9QWP0_9BACL|nr:carbohydrate ABC transporter permease [Paenibacillus taihuensis]REE68115.1 putative aldouronate transport system permease protein [Paenibacillus taihuensis]